MTGRVVDKGDGKWELVVDVGRDPLTGRRKRRSRTVTGGKRAAEKMLDRFVAEQDGQRQSTDATVGRLLDEWLAMKPDLGPSTRQEYVRLIEKRIRPALGATKVRKLTAADLDRFYRALQKGPSWSQDSSLATTTAERSGTGGSARLASSLRRNGGTADTVGLSPSSIRQIHAILSGALEQAVKWEWVDRNVARLATPPKIRRQPVQAPTVAAVLLLIAAATEEDADLGMAALLAAATGARRGELCALRWGNVDLDNGLIRFAETVVEITGQGVVVKPGTKTHQERTVTIDDTTVEALKLRWEYQVDRARRGGVRQPLPSPTYAYVLSRRLDSDRPPSPSNLSARWAALCRKHGAPGIRFHDLRHWSVTTALDAGIPLAAVAARHGHRDGNVTLGVYGHAVDGRDPQTAAAIGQALSGK